MNTIDCSPIVIKKALWFLLGSYKLKVNTAFGLALRHVRGHRRLTQEDFSEISSRTYLSTLERGLKSPTLEKIDQIAARLDVHPLTLLAEAYLIKEENSDFESLFDRIRNELEASR